MNKYTSAYTKDSTAPAHARGQISYAEALAASLVLYAQKNKYFARELRAIFPGIAGYTDINTKHTYAFPPALGILTPPDPACAVSRAWWLKEAITANFLQDSEKAVSLLSAWIREDVKESPRQLVVGVVVVAVPGVTMGKFKVKKKMSAIVRSDLAQKTGVEPAAKVARASNGVVADALDMARGNARMLEPEVADWLWGERKITLYRAGSEKIRRVESEVTELNISHCAVSDKDGPAVIAISPAADTAAQNIYWDLEDID